MVCSFRGVATAIVSIGLTAIAAGPSFASSPRDGAQQSASQPTADQQSNDKVDVGITQQIRRAITSDKNLSTSAHNVKVITEGGHVTLRGAVQSENEKKQIEAKAVAVAGAGHVKNELSVSPSTKKSTKSKS